MPNTIVCGRVENLGGMQEQTMIGRITDAVLNGIRERERSLGARVLNPTIIAKYQDYELDIGTYRSRKVKIYQIDRVSEFPMIVIKLGNIEWEFY